MLNDTFSTSTSNITGFKLNSLSLTEQLIYWTIVLTPLWWLLGIQTLLYPGISIGLLVIYFDLDKVIRGSLPACIWAWLAMSIVMIWTAIFGLSNVGFDIQQTASTAVTVFKSYFLIFACATLPFWNCIRVCVITRAVAWMTTGYLATIAIEMVMLVLGIGKLGLMPPLARMIPGDKLSLKVAFAEFQPFFNIPLPRTSIYTPDPPILGVCAVLCFFICLGETDHRLRRFALAGCLVALLVSFSRLAWVCLPLALLITACFHSRLARQGPLWVASFTALLCSIWGLTFSELVKKPLEVFNNARGPSSADRETVVRKTLEAWQQSPWIGWGIPTLRYKWYIYDVYLGSFSTYAGVLYLHGIVGFIFFIAALGLTLGTFWKPAVGGNLLCQQAFASLMALYVLCNGTPLSWMGVYFWFFFVWLGAILSETQQPTFVSRWEQLTGRAE